MNYYNIYVIEFTATGGCERYYSKGEMKNRVMELETYGYKNNVDFICY